MRTHDFRIMLMVIGISVAIMQACTWSDNSVADSNLMTNSDSIKSEIEKTQTVRIIITLPSPVETAIILKKAGAGYNEEILNTVTKMDKYQDNKSMALNLGIFCTDLSYASLFDQHQTSMKYMSASKKLADRLGIINAIDQGIITRLESNVNNKDSIINIISESFYNTNSYLTENKRTHIAKMILAGGWIEGAYLSAHMAKNTRNNTEILNRMAEQKLTLQNLIDMLKNDSKNPSTDMVNLITQLEDLNQIFQKIEIKTSSNGVVEGKNNIATIESKNELNISIEILNQISEKVGKLRANIVC